MTDGCQFASCDPKVRPWAFCGGCWLGAWLRSVGNNRSQVVTALGLCEVGWIGITAPPPPRAGLPQLLVPHAHALSLFRAVNSEESQQDSRRAHQVATLIRHTPVSPSRHLRAIDSSLRSQAHHSDPNPRLATWTNKGEPLTQKHALQLGEFRSKDWAFGQFRPIPSGRPTAIRTG